jgi:hypothetical protein
MPLFPFVWQYNNQPIEVLAADVAEIVINDANYIPISTGTAFVNSPIFSNGSVMRSMFGGALEGFVIDAFNDEYKFGALEGATNATNVEIVDDIGDAKLTCLWQGVNECTWGIRGDVRTLYTNGTTAPMLASTIQPLALKVKVDGVNYKLPLYQ